MTMEEMLKERESEGRTAGRNEGQAEILQLIAFMSEDGLTGEIPKLKADEEFLSAMLEKYHLK